MAITLQKGGNLSLSKEAPGLKRVLVGLGWDARATDGQDFDLDASAFLLSSTERVRSDADFIFYNQLTSQCGSVKHLGDNRTGSGDGDDEAVEITLDTIPTEVQKIAFTVTIYDGAERRQNFGMVKNAYIRVVNAETDQEIGRYDLSEDASIETAMIFGEIYRHNNEWKFRAVGQGYQGGLRALALNYGVNL